MKRIVLMGIFTLMMSVAFVSGVTKEGDNPFILEPFAKAFLIC